MKTTALLLALIPIFLAGCAGTSSDDPVLPGTATRTAVPSATAAVVVEPAEEQTRTDEQGAVVFVVTPLNLDSPGGTLDFEVVMETHSVDLGWNLAALAVLRTDSGEEVQATAWPIGSGHHYSGTLSFPATKADGEPILDGAVVLTLSILGTDVPERVFVWELGA
jgi:hypothetical protein